MQLNNWYSVLWSYFQKGDKSFSVLENTNLAVVMAKIRGVFGQQYDPLVSEKYLKFATKEPKWQTRSLDLDHYTHI